VGDVPFYVKIWRILTHPLAQRPFSIYFARSASAATPSKKVQLTLLPYFRDECFQAVTHVVPLTYCHGADLTSTVIKTVDQLHETHSKVKQVMLTRTQLIADMAAQSCTIRFLANVNSCSCSLYVVVRPSVVCLSVTFGGLNQRVLEKCIDFGPLRGYISETVQDRR